MGRIFYECCNLVSLQKQRPKHASRACIVSSDKRIVSLGYNGMPRSKFDNDKVYPWKREGEFSDVKYTYAVHSELNAILNSRTDLRGCTIYVTLFPCNECAKAIIQSGIKEVVYLSNKYENEQFTKASLMMLDNAGIVCRQYLLSGKEIDLKI